MKPKVSVVLPVYNGERFLVRAIESVLSQEVPVHELIVINDGSTDQTKQLLERYSPRAVVRHIPNGGVARAMSLGMSLATGDWIAFIDHDDVWFRAKLSRFAELAAQYPQAGFFCSNYAVRPNGLGRRLVPHFSKLDVRKILERSGPLVTDPIPVLMHENIVGTSTSAIVRADIAQEVGKFNEQYRISGDYDFWLRCALHTSFIVCPEMLFYKRTHAGNISADEIRMLDEHRQILGSYAQINSELLKNKGLRQAADREMALVNYRLGHLCFESGSRPKAFSYYATALQTEKSPANAVIYLTTCLKKGLRMMCGDRGRKASS